MFWVRKPPNHFFFFFEMPWCPFHPVLGPFHAILGVKTEFRARGKIVFQARTSMRWIETAITPSVLIVELWNYHFWKERSILHKNRVFSRPCGFWEALGWTKTLTRFGSTWHKNCWLSTFFPVWWLFYGISGYQTGLFWMPIQFSWKRCPLEVTFSLLSGHGPLPEFIPRIQLQKMRNFRTLWQFSG